MRVGWTAQAEQDRLDIMTYIAADNVRAAIAMDELFGETASRLENFPLAGPDGKQQVLAVRGPLRSNNLSAVLAGAREGLGIAVLPLYVARESLAEGDVKAILERYALPTQEIHAVYPSPKLVPGKVRAFIDFLRSELEGPWWERGP